MFRPALFLFLSVLSGSLLLGGCDRWGESAAGATAIRVNDLRATAEDLRQERAWAREPVDAVGGPPGQEPEWVTRFIERELLVQEAQRLGLDRKPAFMRSVERVWKEALVKEMVGQKAREIASQAHVYEAEIEAYYRRLEGQAGGKQMPPLEAMKGEIEKTLRQQKETEAMEQWLQGLRAGARIELDRQEIQRLR